MDNISSFLLALFISFGALCLPLRMANAYETLFSSQNITVEKMSDQLNSAKTWCLLSIGPRYYGNLIMSFRSNRSLLVYRNANTPYYISLNVSSFDKYNKYGAESLYQSRLHTTIQFRNEHGNDFTFNLKGQPELFIKHFDDDYVLANKMLKYISESSDITVSFPPNSASQFNALRSGRAPTEYQYSDLIGKLRFTDGKSAISVLLDCIRDE